MPRIQDLFRLSLLLYAKPARLKTAGGSLRARESQVRQNRLSGRCLVTLQLMSQMIGVIFQNSKSTIDLLEQDHSSEFVG